VPAAFAVYIAVESEVDEVPPLVLGVLYGLLGAAGVGTGVLIRRFVKRNAKPS
jgi:F0F1-type ATP synthase beta subunit